jgi:ribonuclease Z
LIGWLTNGGPADDIGALAIELAVMTALLAAARKSASPTTVARRGLARPATIAVALVVIAAAGVSATMLSPTVSQALFDRAAKARTSTANTAQIADDALRIAICGSSAPLPSADRAKACVAVFAGGKFYVVDVGPESVENLVLSQMPLSSIGGVLLTHFHSDHIGDLGELNLQTWANGRPAPLPVYGGPGVERIVKGFNEAYQLDQGYRTAHHGAQLMSPAAWPMEAKAIALPGEPTPAKDRSAVVLDDGALKITAIEVDHAPIAPAYAYRFDYKGRSAVVTGDLKYHAPLAKAASGADVLVSEAIALSMTRALGAGARSGGRERAAAIMHDIEDYHITPEQAATIANQARVKLLVFYHLLPSPDGLLTRRLFAQGLSDVRKDGWEIADDGSLYTLPLGSDRIHISRLGDE